MHPELLAALTQRRFAMEPATLEGFQRHTVTEESYPPIPAIVPEPEARVEGVLIREVDEESLRILDRFEEVESGLYRRERVVVDEAGESCEAWAYIAGSKLLPSLAGDWDPTDFFDRHYELYRARIIPEFLGG